MLFKGIRKRSVAALILALSMTSSITASAAEAGIIQKFKMSKTNAAKSEVLWNNRELNPRRMEWLDRGLNAIKTNKGVFVSWRWLGTESNKVKYNLYRDGKRINPFELNITNFTDVGGTTESVYQVASVTDGVEGEKCEGVKPWSENKLDIPLDIPKAVNPDGTPKLDSNGKEVLYEPNECSISDLDGDGQYEIVLKWEATDRQDNSIAGITSPCIIDAYEMDGRKMWRINLGYNIRGGSHYTQFIVYDLDGDGKSEMVCKTADGSVDNEGNIVGDKKKLWRSESGYILEGPEYLTVFDAEKGTIIDTVDYEPQRGNVEDWGDSYGNRVDRFLGGVAYLDGENPSVYMCRGYYTRMVVAAYDLVDKKLVKRWVFDSDKGDVDFMGEGNHSVTAADVDMDGKDEIIYGAAVVDDDGTGLYATGLGHGDAQHTTDHIPSRPGLEIFSVHEHSDAKLGMEMRDAKTGEFIWGSYEGTDVGRGVSADIDPSHPGSESWAAGKMVASTGDVISSSFSISQNFVIYWDGDLGREVQDGNHIDKWVPEKNKTKLLFAPRGYVSFGGTKAPPGITCDLFGDWREETILFKDDRSGMAIFATTDPTDYKIYTLMHDSQYRTYISTQNVAYNQPPHLGYYLGYDTKEIPVSQAKITHNGNTIVNPDRSEGIKFYPIDSLKCEDSIAMIINKPFAVSNGEMNRVDKDTLEVVPYIDNGRTLVPMRFIAEAFGAEVNWNDDKREIVIKQDRNTVKMVIDATSYTVNGKKHELDTPATITKERTFVPLRAAVEALGKKVAWDERGIIYISNTTESLTKEQGDIIYDSISGYVEPEIVETEPVALNYDQLNEKQLPVYAIESTGDDGNIAEGAVDSNFATRWNQFGDNSMITVDLNEVKQVGAVAASYFKGNERMYYFDIAVSEDGESWTTVLENQASSGTADAQVLEMFELKEPVNARYVRYIGHGSSSNDSNNIWVFVIMAP